MENKDSDTIKEGDMVDFPKNHNSMFTGTGQLTVITGEWCKVIWKYKGALKTWKGKLSEVRKSYAIEKNP